MGNWMFNPIMRYCKGQPMQSFLGRVFGLTKFLTGGILCMENKVGGNFFLLTI